MTPLQSMSRRQKSDSKKAASRGLQWTSDMIRKIVDDKTYIGCMVYGKTKIPDPGTGKEVPVPRNQWKVMENHHEPIVSKEVFEKARQGNNIVRWLCEMRKLSQKPDFKQ